MSASSKKKLRKEQNSVVLTEKQRQEQKEAKKLKAYSITFIAIMLVVVITAVSVMAVTAFNRSGIMEKNTIAATIGEHKLNSVEMSYYYNDVVSGTYNDWYNSYGENTATYLQMMGLDVTKPLNEQEYMEGGTWADYFVETALEKAKSDFALYDKAMAEGFTLPEEEKTTLDTAIQNMTFYAQLYGYSDVDQYLQNSYSYGASEKSYRAYSERSAIASAYYNAHADSLTYDDAALRDYEAEKFDNYSSFTYASYNVNYNNYLEGGTENEDGSVTYSDEEKNAARAAAKAVADSLATATTVEELDAAIAALPVNAEKENAASTKSVDTLYTGVTEAIRAWLADDARQPNDITVIANESTTTAEDGTETTVVNGYYVVMFQARNDNTQPLSNVRHLLVQFEKDEEGNVSDDAKAAAKAEADGYLKTWQDGEATEESFIALVKEHSDDGSAEDGGLFEDINPASSYVPSFLNWSIDANRKTGDAEVIESEYGYHVMYYVGDDEVNYRDYMITNDMKSEAMKAWYDALLEPVTVTEGDTSRLNMEMVLSPAS